METIEQTIKRTVGESLAELREKNLSVVNTEITGVETMENTNEIREKALKEAFNEYSRTGKISEKALQELNMATPEAGGMTVPQNIFDKIIEKAKDYSVMRELATTHKISVGNTMELILEDGEFLTDWVSELDSRPSTDAGKFKNLTLEVFEQWAEPKISRQLTADSMFDIEAYLINKVAEAFGKAEEVAFFYGDADKKPTGLLKDATADFTAINYTNLLAMIYDLPQAYAVNSVFVMNRKSMKDIKSLSDENGQPIFTLMTSDLYSNQKWDGSLLGYPVKFSEGVKEGEVVFGDIASAYHIVDKSNDSGMMRDEITEKGKIKYATWKRTGGKPVMREAFKYIKKATK